MKKLSTICIAVVIALGLIGGRAWALELVEFTIEDQADKILVTTRFSEAVKPEVISDYINWRVVFEIEGLVFTKEQLATDHYPPAEELTEFLRFLRFQQTEEYARIGIYLGKPVSPGDTRVHEGGNVITVDLWKPSVVADATAPPDAWPDYELSIAPADEPLEETPPVAEPEETATEPQAGETVPADETAGPESGAVEPAPEEPAPQAEPAEPEPEDAGDAETPVEPEPTGLDDLGIPGSLRGPSLPGAADEEEPAVPDAAGSPAGDGAGPAEADETPGFRIKPPEPEPEEPEPEPVRPPASQPVRPPVKTPKPEVAPPADLPPYTMFDIDDVPVGMLELKGVPFDEALLSLVADSWFNVVIGDGIESTEVNLNFTKKGMTLKNALDVLCIAYDLAYTVQDDAIIIKTKPR